MYMQKINILLLLTSVIMVIGVVLLMITFTQNEPSSQTGGACTEDAMLCPNGSTVGRTGDDCRFVCPDNDEVTIESVTELNTVTMTDITIAAPVTGEVVSNPIRLVGEARGTWYFEGSAPIEVLDYSGAVITEGFITATGDWMTEDYVPFSGTIAFTSPYAAGDPQAWKQGTIVFKKDNPSGLPENAAQTSVPIMFAP